jgi:3'-phosphoadenosine 5'-phosphosulfate sulfotransferase (PAPS reductase)/FAD synthetase
LSVLIRIDMELDDWMGACGYDLVFLGLRKEENKRRWGWLTEVGHTYRMRGRTRCCPLADWTADDVWALIAHTSADYNPVYDRLREITDSDRLLRVGPLPLVRRRILDEGWPALLARLESRYQRRWSD